VFVRSDVTQVGFEGACTPKYHDKHDISPSHFKLTLGQPALLYVLNGER